MGYKDLVIDAAKILDSLSKISKTEVVTQQGKNSEIHYTFMTSDGEVHLVVYVKGNGKCTIQPTGKNKIASEKAADHIVASLSVPMPKNFNISLRNQSKESLITLVNYLVEECAATIAEDYCTKGDAESIKVQGKQGDILTFNLYKTNSLTIQGAPALLAADLIKYLTEDETTTTADLFTHIKSIFKTEVSPEETADALGKEFPNANAYAGGTLRKLLNTAIALRQTPLVVDDYSVVCFPSLKGLECFMKQAVLQECKKNWPDFRQFQKDANNYILPSDVKNDLGCPTTCTLLEECYPVYKAERHTTVHASAVEGDTRIIATRQEALDITAQSLGLIEKHSKALLEKK